MADLPSEIVDLIVDELSGDRPSLLAASLVKRSWVPRSQSHLFRRVVIPHGQAFDRLWISTKGCEHVGQFIRELHIERDSGGSNNATTWPVPPADLAAALLPRLPSLTALTLQGVSFYSTVSGASIAHPRLRHLTLERCAFLPAWQLIRMMGDLAALQTLHLHMCTFCAYSECPKRPLKRAAIPFLSIRPGYTPPEESDLRWLACCLRPRRLVCSHDGEQSGETASARAIIAGAGQVMTHLSTYFMLMPGRCALLMQQCIRLTASQPR
jgi:hypothetical protein